MANDELINSLIIKQWVSENPDVQSIREQLIGKGYDTNSIEVAIKEFKKLKNAKRQTNGFICAGIGAVLGFFSCVLAILNPFPDYFYWILYGFTTIAILLIFAGLIFLLE